MKEISKNLPEFGIYIESRHRRPDYGDTIHTHNFPTLMYVVSGQGSCRIESSEFRLFADTIIMLKSDQNHILLDKPRSRMTVFTIYYRPDKLSVTENIWDFLHQSKSPVHMPVFYARQIRSMLRSMLYEQKTKPAGYKLVQRQRFSLILMSVYRAVLKSGTEPQPAEKPDSSERTAEVLNYIRENYFEPFSLSTAAKMADLSQRQFTNICRRQTGESFTRYINGIRTEKARDLLVSTNIPVSAIAFEVGYEELSTFYRAFKKYQKQNPLDFREHSG